MSSFSSDVAAVSQAPGCPPIPQCEKLRAAGEKLSVIRDFLEWLDSGEALPEQRLGVVHLGYYPFITERYVSGGGYEDIPEDEQEREGQLAALPFSLERVLMNYVGIDEKALSKERDALLQYQRDINAFHERLKTIQAEVNTLDDRMGSPIK